MPLFRLSIVHDSCSNIMCKRNLVHGLTLLVLILASHISAEDHYIAANDSISLCQSYNAETCFTLAQFASNSSHLDRDNKITLTFFPGTHLLTGRLTINGTQIITLTGQNISNSFSTIKCQGTSGFEFTDVQSLDITYLRFSGCGNVLYGGAIFISRADNILIIGCHFINNHVMGNLSKGGAIYAENTAAIKITDSYLCDNSASHEYDDVSVTEGFSYGGAILVLSGIISSTSNQYINNSADYGGAIHVDSGNVSSFSDYYINNSAGGGGAINVDSGDVSSTSDYYINNSAGYGGVILLGSGNVASNSNHYINNSANDSGGAVYVNFGNICSIGDFYRNNSAGYGGAIYVEFGEVSSTSVYYINNSAGYGGAILLGSGNISCTRNQYINNNADERGAAILLGSGNISSISNQYINNNADERGGAILLGSGNISSISNQYIKNNADERGGAINVDFGSISSTSDYYIINSAEYGGAILVWSGYLCSNNNHYINNRADSGGALHVDSGGISSTRDHYINNTAGYGGGAMYVILGNITSTNNRYISNSAEQRGGSIFVESGKYEIIGENFAKFSEDNFEENSAVEGAVIYKSDGGLEICQSNITDNFATSNGILYINSGSLSFSKEVNFMNNRGSLYVFNTKVEFKGFAAFNNNLGNSGGAITAILSQIAFNTASTITITNNTATYGGGISLTQSSLHVYHSIELASNQATDLGGGIYAYQSEIEFKAEQMRLQRSQINNNAASSGGAICAIASNLKIAKTYLDFDSNVANQNGGAIYLEQNSKIYVQKNERDSPHNLIVKLDFTGNFAEKGGAIYVADKSNDRMLCQAANTEIYQTECFIQTLGVHKSYQDENTINTFFSNNTAHQSGSDIYGGLLDRCSINPTAELVNYSKSLIIINGFDYIKATTQIEHIVYHSQQLPQPDYFIRNISKTDVIGLISSDAVQVEFCLDNVMYPNYSHPNLSKKKGEMFTISLVAVDQVGNPLNASIKSYFSSKSEIGRLNEGQGERQIGSHCTELEFNVYSHDNSAQLNIHAIGPCGSMGVSRKAINLFFLPCTCPIGFQPSPSETDCNCECNQRLRKHQITTCSPEIETILVDTNIWIGVTNSTNGMGFVIHDTCPFDYCIEKPVTISLSSPENADKQCAYNRTRVLCGMCKEDLSLVFGSSRCEECSSYYLFLLIPFSLAGIALIIFIVLLNLTVAAGTIHGLILYANILTAGHSLFLPYATPNFLTVFISWLNLDLGIETCFYNGMDSYSKFLLQLAFPIYVFLLIVFVIVLCEVSQKFATLLGSRNPVAALCTLFLLSYSKLIRTIITALQFTHLEYSDGSNILWLYDANVPYFSVSHIPRFVAAFIIIILGAFYTTILIFGQWFPICSKRKCMKWTKNTKYNAFMDAYHAPFTPKHRYWMGLLLFSQIIHNIVAAMATDSPVVLLSAGCVTLGLILLKLLNTRIYKSRFQDSLETLSLINIVILALSTIYIRETNKNGLVAYHITKDVSQLALVYTSMAISFILFLVILGYHFYNYILKGTQVWARVSPCFQRSRHSPNSRELHQVASFEEEEPLFKQDTLDSNNQLREPALDILVPVYTGDYRDPLPSPVFPKPPKITYTVIDAIPRPRDGSPVPCKPAGQNL